MLIQQYLSINVLFHAVFQCIIYLALLCLVLPVHCGEVEAWAGPVTALDKWDLLNQNA